MKINPINNINNQTFGMAVTTDRKTLDFIYKNLRNVNISTNYCIFYKIGIPLSCN